MTRGYDGSIGFSGLIGSLLGIPISSRDEPERILCYTPGTLRSAGAGLLLAQ